MGTPEFAVSSLQALIETQTVVGVVTQPDRPSGRGRQLRPTPVKEAAAAVGIPVYQPKSLRKEEAVAPLREWQPELIVVAAFGQILRPHVLDLPPLGCLNVHASLLPRWRGAAPIQHAILSGDTETGITLMKMDPGLDTGPLYVQQAIPIQPEETAASLHDRLADLGGDMLRNYLDDIVNGRFPAIAQDNDAFTYAPMIQKEDGLLDWNKTAAELDRHIRAMTPWPGAFTTWKETQLKILAAYPVSQDLPASHPGEVVQRAHDKNGRSDILVAAASGALALQTVQLAGKRAVSVQDFVRGQLDFIGSTLGN